MNIVTNKSWKSISLGKVKIEKRDDGYLFLSENDCKITLNIPNFIEILFLENDCINVKCIKNSPTKEEKAFLGLWYAKVFNIVNGMNNHYKKVLQIKGTGYGFFIEENNIKIIAGYSHPIFIKIPENINLNTKRQDELSIFSFDKEVLGQLAVKIKDIRPINPYTGKGISVKGDYYIKKKSSKS